MPAYQPSANNFQLRRPMDSRLRGNDGFELLDNLC